MLKTLKNINLKNKKVLFRVAYDITLQKKGGKWLVPDDSRIRATLPTLRYLLKNNCAVVILSWLGRPQKAFDQEYSLKPVAARLEKLIRKKVKFSAKCPDQKMVSELKPGEILMLENVRFNKKENNGDFSLAKDLVENCDLVVFEAFAQMHRVTPSTVGILKQRPAVIGYLVEKELKAISRIVNNPPHPYVVLVGGAKIDDKIGLIEGYLKKADKILVAGGPANVFLKVQGYPIGKSVAYDKGVDHQVDVEKISRYFLKKYGKKIVTPVDFISADKISSKAKTEYVEIAKNKIRKNWQFLDIGPKTVADFCQEVSKARSLFWNGPLGVFEINKFANGSKMVAACIAKNKKCLSIIGGGDTEAAISKFKLDNCFYHVSTGGGASLEYAAGKELPVLKALKANWKRYL